MTAHTETAAADRPALWPVLTVMAGAILLSYAPIGVRISEIGPQATAFWRFVFALLALAPMAFLMRGVEPAGPAVKAHWVGLAIAGVAFGLDIALWHAALTLTTVLNATLMSNMTPILAALAGYFFLKEKIARGYLIGAGIALVGVLLLSTARAQAGQGVLAGDLLGLASAFWYALYLIILRVARQRVHVLAAMLWTTVAALITAAIATAATETVWLPQSAAGWATLVGLGLVAHVGGQGLIALGLGRLPIALSTVLLWLQPLCAAGLSWALFGEALGPLALVGAALVLGGVWVVQRGR